MISLKRVLIPVDFSEHSAKSVNYGAELASMFGADLHVIHVVETPLIMYGEGGAYVPPDTVEDLEAAAVAELDRLEIDAQGDAPVTRKVIQGHPFVEIVRYAKDNDVDLLVVGTHGRGAIAHMLLGSVAEKVVRKAPCPVLVVRAQEHDFVMP